MKTLGMAAVAVNVLATVLNIAFYMIYGETVSLICAAFSATITLICYANLRTL